MTTPLGLVKTATLVFRAPAEGASMNAQQPYGPEARWLYAEITIVRSQDGLSVISWTVVPTSVDLAESSAFSFESAGPAHYFWVLMMVAMPVICIVAIFLIWRGPAFPMRWLWTIGSLIGFTSFNLNWSSGEIGFQPIYISLLAAGLFKFGLFSPWQMRFGIPIVALLFLCWKRRQLCVVDDRAATEWISQ